MGRAPVVGGEIEGEPLEMEPRGVRIGAEPEHDVAEPLGWPDDGVVADEREVRELLDPERFVEHVLPFREVEGGVVARFVGEHVVDGAAPVGGGAGLLYVDDLPVLRAEAVERRSGCGPLVGRPIEW